MLAPQGIPAGEANVPAWELIDSYEDTDTGTAFDYDSGVITVYSVYMVILSLQDHSGTEQNVYSRVNADSSANYAYYDIFTGDATTGATEWILELLGTDAAERWYIQYRGGNLATTPAAPYPNFGNLSVRHFYGGRLNVSYSDVDRIRIWTPDAAAGRLKLYGLNLT